MSQVIPAEGTSLAYSTTQAGTYTTVSAVEELQPPGNEQEEVKTVHLGSAVQTSRAGRIPDPGEVTAKVIRDYNDVTHQFLETASANHVEYWWKVVMNDGYATPASYKFSGWVKSFKPESVAEQANHETTLTIRVTSLPIVTAGV
jgi:hypothetical protein